MTAHRRLLVASIFLFVWGAPSLLIPTAPAAAQAGPAIAPPELKPPGESPQQSAAAPSTQNDSRERAVTRHGKLVILSRRFADEVKENNTIVLSKVAIKARLDRNGDLRGYEAVQIDKGSVVELMGFRAHDILTAINAIPARDLDANREALESADRFDVTIMRKGKTMSLRMEIR